MVARVVLLVAVSVAGIADAQVERHSRCTDAFFSDAALRVDADCCGGGGGGGHRRTQDGGCSGVPSTCASPQCARTFGDFYETCEAQLRRTPGYPQYTRLMSQCTALAHECDPVDLGEAVGVQQVFKWSDATGRCTLDTAAVEEFCRDPVTLAACLEHIADAGPQPEPQPEEPEVEASGCQQVYLGPGVGFVDVMERRADGRCTLSITMLSVVCSGPMFQTCIDFLHSSGEGPGDLGDPNYVVKHPGGGH